MNGPVAGSHRETEDIEFFINLLTLCHGCDVSVLANTSASVVKHLSLSSHIITKHFKK